MRSVCIENIADDQYALLVQQSESPFVYDFAFGQAVVTDMPAAMLQRVFIGVEVEVLGMSRLEKLE